MIRVDAVILQGSFVFQIKPAHPLCPDAVLIDPLKYFSLGRPGHHCEMLGAAAASSRPCRDKAEKIKSLRRAKQNSGKRLAPDDIAEVLN